MTDEIYSTGVDCSGVTQASLRCSVAASVHSIQLQAAAMGDHVLICV